MKQENGSYTKDGSSRTISGTDPYVDTTVKKGNVYRYEVKLRINRSYERDAHLLDDVTFQESGKPALFFPQQEGGIYIVQRYTEDGEKYGEPVEVKEFFFIEEEDGDFNYEVSLKKVSKNN